MKHILTSILLVALFSMGTVTTIAAPADPPTKKELRKEAKREKKEQKKEAKRQKKLRKQQQQQGPVFDVRQATIGDAGKAA